MDVERAAVQLDAPAVGDLQQRVQEAVADATADRVTVLSPPHVSLGYPWDAPPAPEVLDRVAASHPPLPVTFAGADVVSTPRGELLLLRLADPGPVTRLAAALGWDDVVHPHCSLVRCVDAAAVRRGWDVAAGAVPLATTLRVVDVTVQVAGTWRAHRRVVLAGEMACPDG